jgi:hypothetical protein
MATTGWGRGSSGGQEFNHQKEKRKEMAITIISPLKALTEHLLWVTLFFFRI